MANPYDKVDTSNLSGYALKYALARQGGSDDSQAHAQANAATGGSGITQSDWGSISAGHPTGQTYTPNAYNPSYAASSYDEPGYNYYVSQQQPQVIYQTDPQLMQTIQQLQSQISSTQYDPQIQSLISQLSQSVQNMPTVSDIMNAPAMQQMQQAIQSQTDQQMKRARADLAARGMLGEGSTPAAERFGQVAQQAGQQLGSLIPSMMNTQQQMYQGQNQALQNLVNLLSGLDAQKWQKDITNLQTMLPYTQLTAAQQAQLPLDYFNTLMPWMGVTPAQQQNFITGILQSIGKVPGDADYNEWYGLIEEELAGMGKGGGL